MFSTNVTGLIAMTQAILPIFKRRPEGGRGDIINIGSIAGREPYAGGSIYCASKAAVRSFTDALRKELIATRIRIIEIDPGQVETEFSVVRFGGDKEKAKKVYEGVEPLTGQDIAEVVVFAAGRRENVVIADTLVFPSHQVSFNLQRYFIWSVYANGTRDRLPLAFYTGKLHNLGSRIRDCRYRDECNYKDPLHTISVGLQILIANNAGLLLTSSPCTRMPVHKCLVLLNMTILSLDTTLVSAQFHTEIESSPESECPQHMLGTHAPAALIGS